MDRPDHIPPRIWTMAKQSGQRNGSYEQTLRTAEMLLKRAEGKDAQDEARIQWQPFLSYRQTRIISDALMDYDTVIDDDVSALFKLRNWFKYVVRKVNY